MVTDNKIKEIDSFIKDIGIKKSLSPEHKEEGKEHKSLLTGAIEDLENESRKLTYEKKELESNLTQTGEDINLTQAQEINLRKKLTSLANRESELSSKKVELEEKLKKLNFKMSKVSKIKDELKDV